MYDAVEYQHCRVIDTKLDAGGRPNPNPGVRCVHCKSKFSGGPFRIRGHILGINRRGGGSCTGDTSAALDAKAHFQKVEDAMADKKDRKRKRDELDELTRDSGVEGHSTGSVQISIQTAMQPGLKAVADAALGRYVYADGVPFIKTQSEYFQDFVLAVGQHGPGYRPPSLKKLRTSMLDAEVENVKRQLEVGMPS